MGKRKIVSFIPAKGISNRIPRKNVKMMAGKPMIAWTIEASLKSKYISRTFVSTEDAEIKEIALQYGAEVIDRPAELNRGNDPIDQAYFHFKYCLWKEKYQPDYIVFLYPTSPLRTAGHIDEAFELYFKSDSPLLTAVSKDNILPSALFFINKKGELEHTLKENVLRGFHENRNDRPVNYFSKSSAITIGHYLGTDYQTFQYIGYGQPYIMTQEDALDVDTPFDFRVAEMLLKERIERKGG